MTTAQVLGEAEAARSAVFAHLKTLEGPERREGIRKALGAGYGASELARGLGMSRGRIYQLAEERKKVVVPDESRTIAAYLKGHKR